MEISRSGWLVSNREQSDLPLLRVKRRRRDKAHGLVEVNAKGINNDLDKDPGLLPTKGNAGLAARGNDRKEIGRRVQTAHDAGEDKVGKVGKGGHCE